ncbi:hypothetical protein Tco_1535194, partial [Tanacetum coccineum]
LYDGGGIPFQLKSDSLPHAHAQTIKTYYWHQDSRIKKAQDLKTKTFANSDINDPSSEIKLRGRLLESFQIDAKKPRFSMFIMSGLSNAFVNGLAGLSSDRIQGERTLIIMNISMRFCTVGTTPRSPMKFFIQIASFEAFEASQAAIYSDSHLESATLSNDLHQDSADVDSLCLKQRRHQTLYTSWHT